MRSLRKIFAIGLLSLSLACTESTTPEATRKPDVPFVTTPQDVVEEMLVIAEVTADDVVYDLGCGDGRIVVTAARRYGARAIGFDIDPERVAESRDNVQANGVEDLVEIRQEDIFTLDLSGASVVTMYLAPQINARLVPQLEKLNPGSRIVSHDVGLAGIEPDRVVHITSAEEERPHTIYLWTAPLRVSGN